MLELRLFLTDIELRLCLTVVAKHYRSITLLLKAFSFRERLKLCQFRKCGTKIRVIFNLSEVPYSELRDDQATNSLGE